MKTIQLKLEITFDAKCINCLYMNFPDSLEDTDSGICSLKNKEVFETDTCDKHEIYKFYEDIGLDAKIKRLSYE